MKFTFENRCACGGHFAFAAYGDEDLSPATCTDCGQPGYLDDPLSVSVTAERLLFRSRPELEAGEYSLSIVIAVMAVESYLTRMFLGMANYASTFNLPTPAAEAIWEKEYPRSGGFSRPADFVSQRLAGSDFDEFVATNQVAKSIFVTLPNPSNLSPKQYFQNELFNRRNRIVH